VKTYKRNLFTATFGDASEKNRYQKLSNIKDGTAEFAPYKICGIFFLL